jgi:hypothetical protein
MKYILAFILFLASSVHTHAQKLYNTFYAETGGGFHNLLAEMPNGNSTSGGGVSLSLGFIQDQSPDFGIQFGIGCQTYSSVQSLHVITNEPGVDSDGDIFTLQTDYRNWSETNKALFVEFPIGVIRRFPLGDNLHIVAQAGGKLSIPVSKRYVSNPGSITTTGIYEQWNVVLSDVPDQGYLTTTESYKGNSILLTAFSGYASIGLSYPIGWNSDFSLSGYFSTGLYSIGKSVEQPLYEKSGKYHGMFASNQIGKIVPIAIGLRATVYFRLNQRQLPCW